MLNVFTMDLSFFEENVPVSKDIFNIIVAVGWALLLGNMVFQTAKAMMSGIGFDADDPKFVFTRTFVFGFLLLCSRQICDIGLGITKTVIEMLQIPDTVPTPNFGDALSNMSADMSLFFEIVGGFILLWQLFKIFLEVGERYVVLSVLTIMSPLAFSMGGSRSTSEIFSGWVRMYASMCVMLVLSVVTMKLLFSAMAIIPTNADTIVPGIILVVGICRVSRKIDSIVARIGLNPAITGERNGPGVMGLTHK